MCMPDCSFSYIFAIHSCLIMAAIRECLGRVQYVISFMKRYTSLDSHVSFLT